MSNETANTSMVGIAPAEWLSNRSQYAASELRDCVEENPLKLGGVPVLKGSRVSVAQIFAEMAEGLSADEVAADFSLDPAVVRRLVAGMSVCLDRPLAS